VLLPAALVEAVKAVRVTKHKKRMYVHVLEERISVRVAARLLRGGIGSASDIMPRCRDRVCYHATGWTWTR